MRTLKLVLLIVILLSVGIVAGCQEGHARYNDPTKKVIWEPTVTGFYHPKIIYTDAD